MWALQCIGRQEGRDISAFTVLWKYMASYVPLHLTRFLKNCHPIQLTSWWSRPVMTTHVRQSIKFLKHTLFSWATCVHETHELFQLIDSQTFWHLKSSLPKTCQKWLEEGWWRKAHRLSPLCSLSPLPLFHSVFMCLNVAFNASLMSKGLRSRLMPLDKVC